MKTKSPDPKKAMGMSPRIFTMPFSDFAASTMTLPTSLFSGLQSIPDRQGAYDR